MVETVPFTTLLSAIIDNRGRTCPTTDTGLPLIATNCVKNSTLYPVFEKVRFVSDETYRNWFRGHPKPGDLIFVCKGSPGQVCLTPDPVSFCIAQDMVALRADPARVYPPYLFAALRSTGVQHDISNMHVGTLIPHFKKGDFDKLKIPLPSPHTQRCIGDWHLAMEEKIELNRRMNETLEAMAQAIFRDWFVDFGPVRRKVAGATGPVEIMGGVTTDPARAAELASLFPETFDGRELPDGWIEQAIGDLVDVSGGSTPSTADDALWHPAEHRWATPKDLSNMSDLALFETGRRISSAGLSKITSGLLEPGTVLLSSRAPIGYLAIAQAPVAINQGFIALKPTEDVGSAYLFLWCKAHMEAILANANGSTFQEISKKNFRPITSPTPSDRALLTAFNSLAQPLIDRIVAAAAENRTLAETRDYLLPRLMSGKVRVAAAEEHLEAVA